MVCCHSSSAASIDFISMLLSPSACCAITHMSSRMLMLLCHRHVAVQKESQPPLQKSRQHPQAEGCQEAIRLTKPAHCECVYASCMLHLTARDSCRPKSCSACKPTNVMVSVGGEQSWCTGPAVCSSNSNCSHGPLQHFYKKNFTQTQQLVWMVVHT